MTECELPAFYQCTEPVASKDHKCIECSAPILKGEKHVHARGKWSYGVESYRQHIACCEACELIRDKFVGECISFGSLKEEFEELRWQEDKSHPDWKLLRSLMARIIWRERMGRR